jgi:4-hydroxybenzoate polyprenyltransferase
MIDKVQLTLSDRKDCSLVPLPLAVDLDGALLRVDSLHEGLVACITCQPLAILEFARSLARGKAALKRSVSTVHQFDPSLVPYNEELLSYLKDQKDAGRCIGLFTASDQLIADKVATHLGIFDVVRGSNGELNLTGARKVAAIREEFGDRFAYAGDDAVDGSAFDAADRIILVGSAAHKQGLRSNVADVEGIFPKPQPTFQVWLRALRLHHWAKNILVFVAPVLGFPATSLQTVAQAVLLFVLMGLLASAAYIINDILDLVADRQHPDKRLRPFANGSIQIHQGVFAAVVLLLVTFLLGLLLLPPIVVGVLAFYFLLTLAYSLGVKRVPVLDVVLLASLFMLRVLAGSLLVPTPLSPWLLTFSMFFFLGLAMVKRYTELDYVARSGGSGIVSRGYTTEDLPLLLAAGVASGIGAIVIFMIYIINDHFPREIYGTPSLLWAMMPLILIWTLRIWHLTVHGRMDSDPVVFALRDRFSLVLATVAGLILFAAWS